ncbi:glycosyltransferase family 4 protein [Candidatus Viridilinea mediisalina]|uniref:Glycosyl transferase family 1 n=1 Tax=Candidatus Viridilinea mediisalina TaxID=2024553 RepID=A0A2A6RJL2_9CHLR|nr:glycosyltransferase family 4 protein [Candidatus Viridilinea mediisalina]PDW03079.1 glycosyl transferase family 1 [Candidatus Viridilinea mediisalina]
MNVALYNLTTTTRFGGVESFVWDLARELAGRGHAVTVLGGVGPRREAGPGVRVLTFPFVSRRLFQAVPPLRRAYAEAKLAERLTMAVAALPALVAGRYDIIHLQKPYDMGPAILARRLSGAKVLLGCHGEDFYRGDRLLARQMDGAVSCSHFNAATVARRYGFTPTVIFNGIDTQLFRPQPRDARLRPALGIAADAPLLLFVGRLQPWKGLETAIRALALLPGVHLAVAGDGEDRARLTKLVSQLAVTSRLHWLGAVERRELPRIYSSADLLVATSHASETFGIGLVEAQACGLPVVASRFGGFPEVVDEGRTGLLYPPRDAAALAQAAGNLLEDRALRGSMAEAAPAWAAQFTWPAVAERVERVYRRVGGNRVPFSGREFF